MSRDKNVTCAPVNHRHLQTQAADLLDEQVEFNAAQSSCTTNSSRTVS